MRRRRHNWIATLLLLALLVGGMGWLIYAPVRQERLNRALIAAIKKNDTKVALALLADGADPNAREVPPQHLSFWRLLWDRLRGKRFAPSTAPTALLVACALRGEEDTRRPPAFDNGPMVQALLEHGAKIDAKDEQGRTPLQL